MSEINKKESTNKGKFLPKINEEDEDWAEKLESQVEKLEIDLKEKTKLFNNLVQEKETLTKEKETLTQEKEYLSQAYAQLWTNYDNLKSQYSLKECQYNNQISKLEQLFNLHKQQEKINLAIHDEEIRKLNRKNKILESNKTEYKSNIKDQKYMIDQLTSETSLLEEQVEVLKKELGLLQKIIDFLTRHVRELKPFVDKVKELAENKMLSREKMAENLYEQDTDLIKKTRETFAVTNLEKLGTDFISANN